MTGMTAQNISVIALWGATVLYAIAMVAYSIWLARAADAKVQRLIDRQAVKKRGVVKIAFIGIKDMVAGDKAQIPLFFRGGCNL